MEKNNRVPDQGDPEAKQFIDDAARMVIESAAQGAVVHVSQSFSGSRNGSALIVCLVACPESLVLEVQEAIDEAVEEKLRFVPLSIH